MTEQELAAFRRSAWKAVLDTDAGRVVMADILARCGHWAVTNDPELRARQQVAVELLRASGLYSEAGSFPVEYVRCLSGTKIDEPKPEPRPTLLGRILGRKT